MRVIKVADTDKMIDICRRLTMEGATFTAVFEDDYWHITITGV